jgi:dolichol-phosphate mannosyltransferase
MPMATLAADVAVASGSDASIRTHRPVVSVVIPVYNERAGLPRLVGELESVLEPVASSIELVFIDDGSTDGTREWLLTAVPEGARLVVVQLARNFGPQGALAAGLPHATGDVVVVMDGDWQDDPHAIPRFLERWRAGDDVVYAIRTARKESWWKRLLFATFYRTMRLVAEIPVPLDAGNFGLMDRRVVTALNGLPERARYFAGLRRWVGYRQSGVVVERRPRYDGRPRVSLAGLWGQGTTALVGFSSAPVRLFQGLAVVAMLIGVGGLLVVGLLIVAGWGWEPWWSTALLVIWFTALNAGGLGVLGEYLLAVLREVRGRPAAIVARVDQILPRDAARRELRE